LGQSDHTTGLYVEDIKKLLAMLQKLVNSDNTVVVEHNLDVIKSADCIIDLGQKVAQQADRLSQKAVRSKWRRWHSLMRGASFRTSSPRRQDHSQATTLHPRPTQRSISFDFKSLAS
jgi:hypothetical protein